MNIILAKQDKINSTYNSNNSESNVKLSLDKLHFSKLKAIIKRKIFFVGSGVLARPAKGQVDLSLFPFFCQGTGGMNEVTG